MSAGKELIYSAAQELFALHGFAGASISDIAVKAKIAKSTVLHHFPTKQKLYQAVMQQSLSRFAEWSKTADLKKLLRSMVAEPIHAKLLNRVFMDNPKAAEMAAKKYWLPLIEKMIGDKSRILVLFIVNAIFQIAFSIELQVFLPAEAMSKDAIIDRYADLIDGLIRTQAISV